MPIFISGDATSRAWRIRRCWAFRENSCVTIRVRCPYTTKTVSIEMRFDRIGYYVQGRICEKNTADLTGTVMLDHGKPYIYVPELF